MNKLPYMILGTAVLASCKAEQARPNFLIIQCDQLATRAIGAYGQMSGYTGVIDSLARNGVVFDNAYTAAPLSQPSRAAILTGLYPHQTGVRSNSGPSVNKRVDESLPSLGKLFSQAGYNAVHFGKTHDMGALMGFRHKAPAETEYSDPLVPINRDSFKDVGTCEDAVFFPECLFPEDDKKLFPFLRVFRNKPGKPEPAPRLLSPRSRCCRSTSK